MKLRDIWGVYSHKLTTQLQSKNERAGFSACCYKDVDFVSFVLSYMHFPKTIVLVEYALRENDVSVEVFNIDELKRTVEVIFRKGANKNENA